MGMIINSVDICTDGNGRYSLNDLHIASGGEKRHSANHFMRSSSFKQVEQILNTQNRGFKSVVRKTGRYGGGTWVSKELVLKYAMWVNPDFEVKVIQTFLDIAPKVDAPETMQALNELTKKIEGDTEVASKCGTLLARYKKVKRENQDNWVKGVHKVQMNLGFIEVGSEVSAPK